MKPIYTLLLIWITSLYLSLLQGQVAINMDGSNPDSSAILDVKASSKGLLTPRMSTALRTAIRNPAEGLITFDTDTQSFWVYTTTGWSDLDELYAVARGAIPPTSADLVVEKPLYRKGIQSALRYYDEITEQYNRVRFSLNVKDFGAVGDSLTDDHSAIQAALDSLSKENGISKELYFPGGKYYVSKSLVLPSDIRIRGDGAEQSIISCPVSITLDALMQERIIIQDIGVEITSENNFTIGINLDNAKDIVVERCAIYRSTEPMVDNTIHAVLARGIEGIIIRDCKLKFTQIKLAGAVFGAKRCYILNNFIQKPYNFAITSVGKTTANSEDIYLIGNIVEDLPSSGAFFFGVDGEQIEPVDTIRNIYILNNVVRGKWLNVAASDGAVIGIDFKFARFAQNIHVLGNHFENEQFTGDPNTFGMVFKPTRDQANSITQGVFIKHNFLGPNAKQGLQFSVSNAKDIFIQDNVFLQNRGLQIGVEESLVGVSIANNTFDQARAQVNQVDAEITNLNIQNNQFRSQSNFAYAIQLNRDTSYNFGVNIVNNYMTGYQKGVDFTEPANDSGYFYGNVIFNFNAASAPFVNGPAELNFEKNDFTASPRMGTATLANGIVTVLTAEVRTGDVIRINRTDAAGTLGHLHVNNIVNGTSFDIVSSDAADESTVYWEIVH